MSWHCKQIPNGDAPIVVCEREDLTRTIATLTAELAAERAEVERLTDRITTLRLVGDALAATWPEEDRCNCNNKDCRAVVKAFAAWQEARQ